MESCREKLTVAVNYSDEIKEEWDAFIASKSINGTFIHSRKFFDHNFLNAVDDSSLVFYKENKIIAVFPAILYLKDSKLILHSHLRATYGGFVVSPSVGIQEAIDIVEQTILYAQEKKIDQIIVRNSFRIFHTSLCDETDYAMWYHGFKIKSRELEISIQLDRDHKVIKSQYHHNTARNVKKGESLVKVGISNNFEDYWILLEKCLMNQYGTRPTHDYSSIAKLRENIRDDEIILFAAHYKSRLIGGIVIFDFNDLVLHAQYIASDYDFKHLCPVHAIIDYIIEWGHKRGAKYLNLGMGNEDEGQKINYGLFRFKESFGGRGVLRETMYFDL